MDKKILSLILFFLGSAGLLQAQNPKLSGKETKEGWVLLFDGKTTNGWETPDGKPVPSAWEVKDGTISTTKSAKGSDIVTVNEYTDFELSLDFKIEPGTNSGIKYFYTHYTVGGNLGLEYQVLDDQLAEDNKQANHLCGSFYDVLAPDTTVKKVKSPGKWNNVRIVAKGKNVEHWLNGKKILGFTRGSKVYTDAVAKSKFNKTQPAFGLVEKGKILLQDHGGSASFRNIKIKLI